MIALGSSLNRPLNYHMSRVRPKAAYRGLLKYFRFADFTVVAPGKSSWMLAGRYLGRICSRFCGRRTVHRIGLIEEMFSKGRRPCLQKKLALVSRSKPSLPATFASDARRELADAASFTDDRPEHQRRNRP